MSIPFSKTEPPHKRTRSRIFYKARHEILENMLAHELEILDSDSPIRQDGNSSISSFLGFADLPSPCAQNAHVSGAGRGAAISGTIAPDPASARQAVVFTPARPQPSGASANGPIMPIFRSEQSASGHCDF